MKMCILLTTPDNINQTRVLTLAAALQCWPRQAHSWAVQKKADPRTRTSTLEGGRHCKNLE